MEEDKLSVMRATGSSVVIECDLTGNYIHWYKFQEGTGNTLTKSQEHQKQHWGPQHGWDNSETGVPSRCDGQGS